MILNRRLQTNNIIYKQFVYSPKVNLFNECNYLLEGIKSVILKRMYTIKAKVIPIAIRFIYYKFLHFRKYLTTTSYSYVVLKQKIIKIFNLLNSATIENLLANYH